MTQRSTASSHQGHWKAVPSEVPPQCVGRHENVALPGLKPKPVDTCGLSGWQREGPRFPSATDIDTKLRMAKPQQWAALPRPLFPCTHLTRSSKPGLSVLGPSREPGRSRCHPAGLTHVALPGERWGGSGAVLGPRRTTGGQHVFPRETGTVPELTQPPIPLLSKGRLGGHVLQP